MLCSRTKSRPDNAYPQTGRENGRAGRRFLSLFFYYTIEQANITGFTVFHSKKIVLWMPT